MGNKPPKAGGAVAVSPPDNKSEEACGPIKFCSIAADPGYGMDEDDMQDCHFLAEENGHIAMGIVDGHGGGGQEVAEKFIASVTEDMKGKANDENIAGVMKDSMLALHSTITSENCDWDTTSTGCCGTVVACNPGKVIHACWIGDVSLVSVQTAGDEYVLKALSVDHLACRVEEKARILQSGGEVKAWEIDNVGAVTEECVWFGAKHPQYGAHAPGLRVSRVLGHTAASCLGVTCEPEILTYQIGDMDKFVIVASRGLWLAATFTEIATAIKGQHCAEKCVSILMDLSAQKWAERWTGENTTICVVRVDAPAPA